MRQAWMGRTLWALAMGAALAGSTAALGQTSRAVAEIPADKAKVTGTIVIDYNSRSERSQSNVDVYNIQDLAVADLMVLKGVIQRIPEQRMTYSVRMDVINPQNPSQIARDAAILRGDLVIDSDGRYNPEDGNLRLDVVKGNQSSNRFTGDIQGREVARWWQIGKKLKAATTEATKAYSRLVEGKVVSIQVKNPDPLRFEGLGLAAGPFSFIAEAKVSGIFDYDYELGNWLTDQAGVQFTYTVGSNVVSDRVTGSIRYVEEGGDFTDAKSKKHNYTSVLRIQSEVQRADRQQGRGVLRRRHRAGRFGRLLLGRRSVEAGLVRPRLLRRHRNRLQKGDRQQGGEQMRRADPFGGVL